MKPALCFAIILPIVTGCAATPLPEANYKTVALHTLFLQKCFDQGFISPQMYADGLSAASYSLNTWSYDSAKLSNTLAEVNSSVIANAATCRQTEANALLQIASVDRHIDQAAVDQNSGDQSGDPSVICHTFGNTTICN